MITTQQLVVGIFQDHAQAEQAVDELVRTGFDHHQIHFAGPGPTVPTGSGMLEKIKSLFTGQDVSAGWLYNDLIYMGVPPEETRYYQSAFEAGRSIVAVHGDVGMRMASLILARNGGYGANQRPARSANYGTTAGVQEPAPNSEAYDANRRVAQSTDYNKGSVLQEPPPDSEAYGANQRVADATDSSNKSDVQEPTNEDTRAEPHKPVV